MDRVKIKNVIAIFRNLWNEMGSIFAFGKTKCPYEKL